MRQALLVLSMMVLCAAGAKADELVWKSEFPTGSARVTERGVTRMVPCHRTVRRIQGELYVRPYDCSSPAEGVSDIGMPIRQSGPKSADRYRFLANGHIRLY